MHVSHLLFADSFLEMAGTAGVLMSFLMSGRPLESVACRFFRSSSTVDTSKTRQIFVIDEKSKQITAYMYRVRRQVSQQVLLNVFEKILPALLVLLVQ